VMTPRGGHFHVESSASAPKDGSYCCVELNCEDWGIVNEVEYLSFAVRGVTSSRFIS
jgi:hypothetical protein